MLLFFCYLAKNHIVSQTDVKMTDFLAIFDKVSVTIYCSKLKFDVKFTVNTHMFYGKNAIIFLLSCQKSYCVLN